MPRIFGFSITCFSKATFLSELLLLVAVCKLPACPAALGIYRNSSEMEIMGYMLYANGCNQLAWSVFNFHKCGLYCQTLVKVFCNLQVSNCHTLPCTFFRLSGLSVRHLTTVQLIVQNQEAKNML